MRRLLCADQTITSSVGFSDLDNWLRNDGFSIDSDKRAAPEFGGSADKTDLRSFVLRRGKLSTRADHSRVEQDVSSVLCLRAREPIFVAGT